jgi:hypothetical protein
MSPEGVDEIKFEFSHDKITWQPGYSIQEDLSGRTKYLIGRFHHVQGLQIELGRTRMAVEVAFE